MYNETFYLWEDTSSDQSCHPKESAQCFLRLKCACSLHVVPPEQRCLGLGRALFMGCLKTLGGSHWGQWPGNQQENALSPVPMNIPADGHSLGLWLFPRPLFEFSVNFKPKVSDVKQMLRCCEWEHCDGEEKESLKSIWRMLNIKTGSKRQEQAMLQWESLPQFWSANDIFGRGQKVQRALCPRSSLEQDAIWHQHHWQEMKMQAEFRHGHLYHGVVNLSRSPEAGNQNLKDLLLFKHLNNNMLLIRILPKHWELHWATDHLHCASWQRQVYGSL